MLAGGTFSSLHAPATHWEPSFSHSSVWGRILVRRRKDQNLQRTGKAVGNNNASQKGKAMSWNNGVAQLCYRERECRESSISQALHGQGKGLGPGMMQVSAVVFSHCPKRGEQRAPAQTPMPKTQESEKVRRERERRRPAMGLPALGGHA